MFADEAQFFEAENGEIALDILNINRDITLIFLDFNMPVMNGEEFLTILRSDKELNTVRVIMCTTESQKSTVITIMKKGVSGYVVKPFTPDTVRKAILPLVSRLGYTLAI
jgi:two-component system chemotaxis response regulator CheY